MSSCTALLAWSLYHGRRRGYGTPKLAYRPHSDFHVILGTGLPVTDSPGSVLALAVLA
jgi:Amt family ammonium transporter